MKSWASDVVSRTQSAFDGLDDPVRAQGAAKYMKFVAPFIGISAPVRRDALRSGWKGLPQPTSDNLGKAALSLMKLSEREYHYAAFDLIETYIDCADEYFLAEYCERLLTTSPWWDTVDGLVNACVSPLCWRYDATKIIDDWSESEDRWLIRAAIGHQRGWKQNTNVEQIFSICDRHWNNSEFFIAKAIGWALRDIAGFNVSAVQRFLLQHPYRNALAQREASRGIERALRHKNQ